MSSKKSQHEDTETTVFSMLKGGALSTAFSETFFMPLKGLGCSVLALAALRFSHDAM
ncbi:hypothetical protein [Sodalis sp. RH22]|uniref:hypothetical protein n=1 Tax=unclassified Sodalis (in: enterobacteria) TaxID=2636512 RepID=UPI0039B4674D